MLSFLLLVSWALVKRRGNHLRPDLLTAHFNQNYRAHLGVAGRHISEGDVLLEERRRRSAGDVADLLARLTEDLVIVASNAALDHLKSHQSASQPCGFGLLKAIAADEVTFLHFAVTAKICFPDIDRVGDFVPIERHLRFEAQ